MGRAGRAGQRAGPDQVVGCKRWRKLKRTWEEAQKGGKSKCPSSGLEVSQSGDQAAQRVVG